jgi:uncharacterized protein Smg (DUF494 family)
MLNRLMDLVVLVAELSQNSKKTFKELDHELMLRGYSPEEIEQAVFWFTSRRDVLDDDRIEPEERRTVRVLSEWERLSLHSDCYGFLLRLLNLGIIDDEQFEKIIARSIPIGPEKIYLNEVKAIACSVIFNKDMGEIEEDFFDQFDEDIPTT